MASADCAAAAGYLSGQGVVPQRQVPLPSTRSREPVVKLEDGLAR